MHPVLFEHAFGSVNAYGTLILLGTLASMPGIWWDLRGRSMGGKEPLQLFLDLYIALFVGIVVGGRVLHVLTTPGSMADLPARLFSADSTGFVFFGSFFGILVGLRWIARKYGVPYGSVVDLCVTWIPVGHLGGRLGCYLAGCCYGAPSDGALGVAFPAGSIVYLTGLVPHDGDHTVPLHPVQLYEVAGLAILWAVLFALRRRNGPEAPWLQAGRYCVGYGVLRFVVELFRGDVDRGFLFELRLPGVSRAMGMPSDHILALSTSQSISLVLIALGVWVLRRRA